MNDLLKVVTVTNDTFINLDRRRQQAVARHVAARPAKDRDRYRRGGAGQDAAWEVDFTKQLEKRLEALGGTGAHAVGRGPRQDEDAARPWPTRRPRTSRRCMTCCKWCAPPRPRIERVRMRRALAAPASSSSGCGVGDGPFPRCERRFSGLRSHDRYAHGTSNIAAAARDGAAGRSARRAGRDAGRQRRHQFRQHHRPLFLLGIDPVGRRDDAVPDGRLRVSRHRRGRLVGPAHPHGRRRSLLPPRAREAFELFSDLVIIATCVALAVFAWPVDDHARRVRSAQPGRQYPARHSAGDDAARAPADGAAGRRAADRRRRPARAMPTA